MQRKKPTDAVLTLKRLTKSYAGHQVLHIERLVLHRNDRVVMTGTNGSGKSTLLRIIAGIARRDGGELTRARALSALRIGYVPQIGGLYGDLTVAENLRWRRRLFGMDRKDRDPAYPVAYELGLRPYMAKKFADLSGGYQRLATVAAALDIEPAWLLLDEPFSGMDEEKQERTVRLLADLLPRLELLVITAPVKQTFPFETMRVTLNEGRVA